MDIVDLIPHGAENAVSRRRLAEQTGLPDRIVRKKIEAARAGGAIIVNAQDGRGYYQTDDINEIARMYRAQRSRAISIFRACKPMRLKLKEAGKL